MKLDDLMGENAGWHYIQAVVKDITDKIQQFPEDPDGYMERAGKYTAAGFHKEAVSDFTQVIRLDPENLEAQYSRGLSYAELGEHQKAIDDYSRLIDLYYSVPPVYHSRGVSREAEGDLGQAINDYVQAFRLDPKSSRFRQTLDRFSDAVIDHSEDLDALAGTA